MKRPALYRAAFAVAAASVLGFGATQALAAPASAEPPACKPRTCDQQCIAQGLSGGTCFGDECACYIID